MPSFKSIFSTKARSSMDSASIKSDSSATLSEQPAPAPPAEQRQQQQKQQQQPQQQKRRPQHPMDALEVGRMPMWMMHGSMLRI